MFVAGAAPWLQERGCKVFGESICERDTNGQYTGEGGKAYAEATCAAVGGRLCTSDEIRSGCAATSGCDHSHDLVWTSTECSRGGELPRAVTGKWNPAGWD